MTDDRPDRLPRLFVPAGLSPDGPVALSDSQSHYLRHVLRRAAGDRVRLFNGRDGEWLGALEMPGRKSTLARPVERLRIQPPPSAQIHLLFAPLKKGAMDFLIEKSVELGVTHLHPVLTQNTEVRRLNEDRIAQQIVEAAEQCERLTLPAILPPALLADKLAAWDSRTPLFAAIERMPAAALSVPRRGDVAFLIGPEGGFTAAEKDQLAGHPPVVHVSLGPMILRAETAALVCLAARMLAGS